MTVLECYLYCNNRLNTLSTNTSDDISKTAFVQAFNTCQIQWVEDRFKLSETSVLRTDELQQLFKVEQLKYGKEFSNYLEFNLPSDYLHYKRSVSYAPCSITNYLVKEGDINRLLIDSNWKPSLDWGETLCTIAGNKLRVYFDNFSVSKVELHYLRTPRLINMNTGFPDVNGKATENIDPEFKNSNLIEILNLTINLLASDVSDQFRFQTTNSLVQSHT